MAVIRAGAEAAAMREAVLRVRHRGSPESDVSAAHPSVRLRSVSSMTGSADERHRIIEIAGPADDVAAFLDAFRETDPLIAVDPLSPIDASPVLVSITYDARRWDSISELLRDLGVHYRTGTTIVAGWERWTLYLEDEADLRAVIDALRERGNGVDLVRNVSLEDVTPADQFEFATLEASLTDRQREVLWTAIDGGYYEDGSDVTIETIADRIGVSQSTAWEHLQRAERKVMAEVELYLEEGIPVR